MRSSRFLVAAVVVFTLGLAAILIFRPHRTTQPVRIESSLTSSPGNPASIPEIVPVKRSSWDRDAAAANLLLLFSSVGAWDSDYTEAVKALGPAGVTEVVRKLLRTRNSLSRDRDDPRPPDGVDAESILPLLQILAQVKNSVPGLAQEILAWAENGHAAVYNRQIVAALAAVGGADEGGRVAGAFALAELERLRAKPDRGQFNSTEYLFKEISRHGLTGAEETLLKLSDLHGSGLGLISEDASIPQEMEEAVFKALARLDTTSGAKALASSVVELSDAARRESVLAAIAEAVQEKPDAKVAGQLQTWATAQLGSSRTSPAERRATYAIAAGMDRDTVRQLCDARPQGDDRLFAAWLHSVTTAAARHPEAAELCGKLIEEGAMARRWVGEDLSKRLIDAYVAGDSARRRRVMSLLPSVTAVEALAIVQAFPAEDWKDDRNLLKGAVERFRPQRAEGSQAQLAAQIAADRWLDAAENKSEGVQVMQSLAPDVRLSRRYRDPDFATPLNPTADDLARLGGNLRDAPKRRELLGNVKAIAEDIRIPLDAVARVAETPGMTRDFLFAVARGLLARMSPEARALAEALLLKVAPGPWEPPAIEVHFWKCIALLAVRDEPGRILAWKCLQSRDARLAILNPSLAPKLEALKSFLEKCRESD